MPKFELHADAQARLAMLFATQPYPSVTSGDGELHAREENRETAALRFVEDAAEASF
jgi:hypothetical protein